MKRVLALLLVAAMIASFAACGKTGTDTKDTTKVPDTKAADGTADTAKDTEAPVELERPDTWEREEDEDVYEANLSEYTELMDKAKAADSIDEKFVLYAQAEAYLLDSAVMIPTTTRGGAYQISRVAPHTVPYVQWGNDDDRLKGLVISDEFITKEDREELVEQWSKALAGEGEYDPAKYLTDKGHELNRTYTTTFTTPCATFDWLGTSMQSDTEITVNCVDGLVEYDNLNNMQPALAESWEISEDGLTYTFKIREGVKWYTSEGKEYAELTAKDFECGFRHMLDAKEGLEWLVEGVVAGASEYLEGGSWDSVGYKATDDYTLTVTLEQPTSYFLTMLTYSCFLPLCDSFYQSRGGVYGEEYAERVADSNAYTYGINTDVSSQVYCGPFLIREFQADSEIVLVKNENYYKIDDVNVDTLRWIHDSGEDPVAFYNDAVKGTYPATSLRQAAGTLDLAKEDGNFEKYGYVTDTESVTYFGGLNLNRGTFELENGAAKTNQTEDQRIDTHLALNLKSFRQALQFAFDKATQNAVVNGEDLKTANLRNMYTHPQFVKLSADVTVDGKTFKKDTAYGDIVQAYLDDMGSPIQVADGIDGWYHPEEAKAALAEAKPILEDAGVTFPIHIDVVYYSANPNQVAQAQAYKKSVEDTLGAENVVVDLIETTVDTDYYAAGYRAPDGKSADYDMFYGSGWGPDFGDPCTYLDTFLGYGKGYMTKVIGLFGE